MNKAIKGVAVIKSLMLVYFLTGVTLAILAYLVFKYNIKESTVNIVIIAIYILATILGGFITGKKVKEKKFFWGLCLGLLYILIIYIAALLFNKDFSIMSKSSITAFCMCVGGGMLGGMIS